MYLDRIVGLPYDDETLVWTARHVLALNLEGRVWPVEDFFAQSSGLFRVKLVGPGIRFVYEPESRRIITVVPGRGENFGLNAPVPPDFRVDNGTLELLRVSWDRLVSKKWPVTGGGRDWLGIRVDRRNCVLAVKNRCVLWLDSEQGRPPLEAVTPKRREVACGG
ncbi:hypothetical protein GFC01_09500 [Desulfofundulus thermobenzoicus]|uniref:Uncharacterized protein n=1 Tax=Desulfofundulus thermobenzoicus TaxID=29376 RepID=A0A6N7IRF4_9FIRM|nr:hypothetical protein [Desulfofundulus thermobenzoicus]MQL52491.1 hypothetical protein [Desulfofundulus thermobenzoicus]HHW43554.1 hypothetical protein [Desulfotomaculum sp.]